MVTLVNEPIRFGLFDWLDESGRGIGETYQERLELVEHADEAGFYAYHLAEHHGTELSTVPSPNLFLSAVAQRTKRLRLGPMGYVLPSYSPLRLMEEICMLDQLSNGRLDVGIGRGSSPHEGLFFGVERDDARAVFQEALDVILMGLTQGVLNYQGRFFHYDDVPTRLRPVQQPYPPLWYPTTNAESVAGLAAKGFNSLFTVHLSDDFESVVQNIKTYRASYEAHRGDPGRLNSPSQAPLYGFSSHIHVADTDEQAYDQARVAYAQFVYNFTHRYVIRGQAAKHAGRENFDNEVARGRILLGSPETVRGKLRDWVKRSGANYVVGCFSFGSLPRDQMLRSLDLFAANVMPAFAAAAV